MMMSPKVRLYAGLEHIGSKINQRYRLQGVPMSFLYDRSGRLVAVAPEMLTHAQAGLH
jgi:hypothetical protein